MEEQTIYNELKDELCIQDEALKKLIWILYRNFYYDNYDKQNILLIGERGTGKTTMVREVANSLGIPMGEVYNMFSPKGLNMNNFITGAYNMMNENGGSSNGIIVLHDFQNCFLYGISSNFNSMVASGTINFDNKKFYDVSNVTLIGEIDTNNMEDIFPKEYDTLFELENGHFVSPTLNFVKLLTTNANKIQVDENGNKIPNPLFEKYISEQMRQSFLSPICSEAFNKKIFMDNMWMDDIVEALQSPHSVLNLYNDDLNEEYKNSDAFLKKVAAYIMESAVGLHAAGEAIESVALNDSKHDEKVLKKGSLLKSTK